MALRWFCIQLLPNFWRTAETHLRRQHFEPFFPMLLVKGVALPQPLFKGYGFVRFDPEIDQWLAINGTRGVVGLLPRKKLQPNPLPDGFVERLIEGNPWGKDSFNQVVEELFPGLPIYIKEGILEGRTGNVVSLRAKLIEITLHNTSGYRTWVERDTLTPLREG